MASGAAMRTPDTQGLRQQLAEAHGRHAALVEEVRTINGLTSPYVDRPGSASRVDTLRARARAPEARRDLELAEAECEELERELKTAEETERRRRQAQVRERLRPVIRELAQALDQAAAINSRVLELEVDAGVGQVSAPWLAPESALTGSLLASWRRFCREADLLD